MNLATEQPDDLVLEDSTILDGGGLLSFILLEEFATPQNTDAVEVADNLLMCRRTNFKIKVRHGLIPDGEDKGLLVRHESRDKYHEQNRVRSKAENLPGSPRPEHQDKFVGTITADDL